MDIIGIGGFILSAIGVGLSIFAVVQAGRAENAVNQVIQKSSEQLSRDDARKLLVKLNDARDAALARRGKAPKFATSGRSAANDLRALQLAQDALATTALSADAALEQGLRVASTELDRALKEIHAKGDRDGWADALGVLQGVIPKVDAHQRKLGAMALK